MQHSKTCFKVRQEHHQATTNQHNIATATTTAVEVPVTPPTVSIGVDESHEFLVVLSFGWLVVVVNPAFIFTLFSVVACRAIAIRIAGVDESRAFLVALSSSSSSSSS